MSKEFKKKPITYLLLALLLTNVLLSTGCGVRTDESNLMRIYNSKSEKVLLQHQEIKDYIGNLTPDTYPFKLISYLDTAKKMYGRDMTDEDFAYCSIMGWGSSKDI